MIVLFEFKNKTKKLKHIHLHPVKHSEHLKGLSFYIRQTIASSHLCSTVNVGMPFSFLFTCMVHSPDIDWKPGVQLFFNLCNLGAMLISLIDMNLKVPVIVKARLKGSDQLVTGKKCMESDKQQPWES